MVVSKKLKSKIKSHLPPHRLINRNAMAMFGDIERKLIKLPQFAHKANGVVGGLAGRCNRPGCQAKPARMASCFATGPISCCLIIYPVCYSDIEVMEVIPKENLCR